MDGKKMLTETTFSRRNKDIRWVSLGRKQHMFAVGDVLVFCGGVACSPVRARRKSFRGRGTDMMRKCQQTNIHIHSRLSKLHTTKHRTSCGGCQTGLLHFD